MQWLVHRLFDWGMNNFLVAWSEILSFLHIHVVSGLILRRFPLGETSTVLEAKHSPTHKAEIKSEHNYANISPYILML
jgi:hypothetical protein